MAKFLFVSSIFRNLQFRRGLIKNLLVQKHEVTAVAAFDGSERLLDAQGVRCIPLFHIQRGGMNPLKELRLLSELYGLYKSEKPDLILHYTIKPNIYGSIAAGLSRAHSISTVTGGGYTFGRNGPLHILSRNLYKMAFLFPRTVFFQNRDDRGFFESSRLVHWKKTRKVPGSGVDLGYYYPRGNLNKAHRKSDELVFLFIGRLLQDKGIGEFVSAADMVRSRYPKTQFQVLGPQDHGNPSAVSEEMMKSWGQEKAIRYLEFTEDVRPVISESDVVVLPSYREGIPRSLLEAMAMSKPIITTDAIGCREVVEDGKNGFMVPVKNTADLATAMLNMIALGEQGRREMGQYGRLKAEREFDEGTVIRIYMEEIERILKENKKA